MNSKQAVQEIAHGPKEVLEGLLRDEVERLKKFGSVADVVDMGAVSDWLDEVLDIFVEPEDWDGALAPLKWERPLVERLWVALSLWEAPEQVQIDRVAGVLEGLAEILERSPKPDWVDDYAGVMEAMEKIASGRAKLEDFFACPVLVCDWRYGYPQFELGVILDHQGNESLPYVGDLTDIVAIG